MPPENQSARYVCDLLIEAYRLPGETAGRRFEPATDAHERPGGQSPMRGCIFGRPLLSDLPHAGAAAPWIGSSYLSAPSFLLPHLLQLFRLDFPAPPLRCAS